MTLEVFYMIYSRLISGLNGTNCTIKRQIRTLVEIQKTIMTVFQTTAAKYGTLFTSNELHKIRYKDTSSRKCHDDNSRTFQSWNSCQR